MKEQNIHARISAGVAFLGILLGAFGAHALKDALAEQERGLANWQTASHYHLLHGVVLYFLAITAWHRWAWRLMLAGVVCFSGSLYFMALYQWKWLWPVTPLGGLLLLAGWAVLALRKSGRP